MAWAEPATAGDNPLHLTPLPFSNPRIAKPNTALRDPSNIIKTGATYYVYFTHVPSTESKYPNGYQGTVYVATSTDLASWTVGSEMIGKGGAGRFDEGGVFTPDVLKEGNKYYLVYTGIDGAFPGALREKIGLATSSSPTGPFTKQGAILEPGSPGQWDAVLGGDTSFVKVRDEFRIYYTATAAGGHYKHIGYIYSSCPSGPFVKYSGNPVIVPDRYGHSGLEAPAVFWNRGQLNCIADIFTKGSATRKMIHLSSSDGIKWSLVDAEFVSAPSELDSHAAVYAPGAYTNSDGITTHMIYHYTTSGAMTLGISRLKSM
jgi:hypothetical protein